MTSLELERELITLSLVVLGCAVLGLSQLLSRSPKTLFVPGVLLAGWSLIGLQFYRDTRACWLPPLILAVAAFLLSALRSPRLLAVVHKPRVHGLLLLLIGPAVVLGLMIASKPAVLPPPANRVLQATGDPKLHERERRFITDKGHPIAFSYLEEGAPAAEEADCIRAWAESASLARTGPADLSYNCHGWIFAAGLGWVQSSDVERILEDNRYQAVKRARVGDLIVYYRDGGITHTGLVRVADRNGPVMVESKWCWLGRFLHAPTDSPYGSDFTFFRSPRNGHELRSVTPKAPYTESSAKEDE